jgi:hypothetical protein
MKKSVHINPNISMSKKKNIIRAGDKVKIVNPEVVIRCGYPLDVDTVIKTLITKEQRDSIRSMMETFGCKADADEFLMPQVLSEETDDDYWKILTIMAYRILKQNKFGGKERTLHTETKESLRNKIGYVREKKVVKTGKYHPGGAEYSYDGEYDYCPAYLQNEKSHVLCKVDFIDYTDMCPLIIEQSGVWIENINLIKSGEETCITFE